MFEMPKKQTAMESLQMDYRAHERVTGRLTPADKNRMVARNILHEELGMFADPQGAVYSLDEDTRDRLLAHARQDASHALCNTISLMSSKSQSRLLLIAIGLLAYIAYRVS
ncbi:MAG: hypothetical protein E5X86_22715 [Mesorhizobium sp.]|uniref:hypothetical protein n=1 Tax=Mesorhizobium sp. TaxID=1871066 RepID=UPI001206F266|nr:hypothetical protein [Mesorhizobium sp.]TIO14931.1 MAG: hypothetical protein E5X86_22715 [Mesorhizobium sp.]